MKKNILEVCADSIKSVAHAAAGGARRVELCQALSAGGLTPTPAFAERAVQYGIPVNILIRLREGDFVYDPDEIAVMAADISALTSLPVNGFVIGALTPQGDIDKDACRRMIDCAGGREITFHRAFDMCRNPFEALEDIINIGCNRILTSGCQSNAVKGAPLIAQLVNAARGRISIMPGAGVNSLNAADILRRTAAFELHASASRPEPSAMTFCNNNAKMGRPDADEFIRRVTSVSEVKAIVNAINSPEI